MGPSLRRPAVFAGKAEALDAGVCQVKGRKCPLRGTQATYGVAAIQPVQT